MPWISGPRAREMIDLFSNIAVVLEEARRRSAWSIACSQGRAARREPEPGEARHSQVALACLQWNEGAITPPFGRGDRAAKQYGIEAATPMDSTLTPECIEFSNPRRDHPFSRRSPSNKTSSSSNTGSRAAAVGVR